MSWWAPKGVAAIGPLKTGKWDDYGRPADRRERTVVCGCGCKTKFKATDPRQKYFDHRHKNRAAYKRPLYRGQRARRRKRMKARPGLVCRWCEATNAEVAWSATTSECSACARARQRCSCPKCSRPVTNYTGRSWCVDCDRIPAGYAEVILLDAGSNRERTVWRKVFDEGQWVSVAYRKIRLKADPLVLTLPTAQWVRVRR